MYNGPGIRYFLLLLALAGAAWFYNDRRDLEARRDVVFHSNEQVMLLEQELAAARQALARLEERVTDLHGDPVEMEAAIRRNKNLAREGERIYRVILPEERAAE